MTDVESIDIRIERNDRDRPNTRVSLRVNGAIASRTWIVPLTISVGRATVQMDGISGVETVAAQRNLSYSRRVLTAALEHIKAGDASLSTLYGIADYYPRWGYATVGGERRTRLSRLDVDNSLPPGYTARTARATDLFRIASLYEDGTRDAVGAVIRDEAGSTWQRLARSIDEAVDDCRVITDPGDNVLAYAWRGSGAWWMQERERDSPGALNLGEAFADSPRSADALLAAIRQWAVEAGKAHADLHQAMVGPS